MLPFFKNIPGPSSTLLHISLVMECLESVRDPVSQCCASGKGNISICNQSGLQ